MKSSAVIAVAAALLGEASATYNFGGSKKYNTPANCDNKCTEAQKGGFKWENMPLGKVDSYNGFEFKGFTCESGFNAGKTIKGSCGSKKETSPKIGCDSTTVEQFSIKTFNVKPEFDCDLEFHFDMPDGSNCKTRSTCSKFGTSVPNKQCGGAKNVTVVYPSQPDKPAGDCKVEIPEISFDCNGKVPGVSKTVSVPVATLTSMSSSAKPTSSLTTKETTSSNSPLKPSSSSETTPSYGKETPSKSVASSSTATTPAEETTSSNSPLKPSSSSETTPSYGKETTPSYGKETTSTVVESSTITKTTASLTTTTSTYTSTVYSTETTEVPVKTTSTETSTTSTNGVVTKTTTSYGIETTAYTTEYLKTSTIFTTRVKTITSCAPTVTDCPAAEKTSTLVVTDTVILSTTINPVTETRVATTTKTHNVPVVTTVPTYGVTTVTSVGTTTSTISKVVSSEVPVVSTGVSTSIGYTTSVVSSSKLVSSSKPVPTSPSGPKVDYPELVPSCLNTWMDAVACSGNTDASCYCPNAEFIQNVFDCIYANGENDDEIKKALLLVQGICASHVGTNPCVVTGVDKIVPVLKVVEEPKMPVYATVTITATTIVPCEPTGVPSVPAGVPSVPAGVPSVPAGTAPVGTAPVGTAPAGSVPAGPSTPGAYYPTGPVPTYGPEVTSYTTKTLTSTAIIPVLDFKIDDDVVNLVPAPTNPAGGVYTTNYGIPVQSNSPVQPPVGNDYGVPVETSSPVAPGAPEAPAAGPSGGAASSGLGAGPTGVPVTAGASKMTGASVAIAALVAFFAAL
ncbi:hypothetical protein Cpir12675_005551 [Ceratocystis pirilliformis]|uniref:CFEM domain-containing protein n=1 Tax=Ceratocystis pirilliformis TaxID=259994 RepID=A0ABR3YQH6_9PEZI